MQLEEYNQHFSSQLQTQLLYFSIGKHSQPRASKCLDFSWILIRPLHYLAAASVPGNISKGTVTTMRKDSLTRGHTSQYDKLQAALVDKSKILMFCHKSNLYM